MDTRESLPCDSPLLPDKHSPDILPNHPDTEDRYMSSSIEIEYNVIEKACEHNKDNKKGTREKWRSGKPKPSCNKITPKRKNRSSKKKASLSVSTASDDPILGTVHIFSLTPRSYELMLLHSCR